VAPAAPSAPFAAARAAVFSYMVDFWTGTAAC
jgi:hypothetical protein